jgi:pimeloyl-ACP methyl ester carboxylesterase
MPGPARNAIIAIAAVATALAALTLWTNVNVGWIEAAHPPLGRFVEVEGGRLHVVEIGNAAGPPLVLLHGAATNLQDMRLALGDRLAADYRVVLVDRPGYGWSDRPGGRADVALARQAKLLHQALTRLGAASPVLVAHSWGSALALAYALDYPQDVRGLVLLAPATHPWPVRSVAWPDSVITALLETIAMSGASPFLGPLVAHTLALPVGKVLLGLGVRSMFDPQPPGNYIEATGAELLLRPSEFVANAQDISTVRENLQRQSARYGTMKVPAVILTGDNDATLSPDVHAKAAAAALPAARLVVLPEAGHMVHHAAPDRVVAAIADVLEMARGH